MVDLFCGVFSVVLFCLISCVVCIALFVGFCVVAFCCVFASVVCCFVM